MQRASWASVFVCCSTRLALSAHRPATQPLTIASALPGGAPVCKAPEAAEQWMQCRRHACAITLAALRPCASQAREPPDVALPQACATGGGSGGGGEAGRRAASLPASTPCTSQHDLCGPAAPESLPFYADAWLGCACGRHTRWWQRPVVAEGCMERQNGSNSKVLVLPSTPRTVLRGKPTEMLPATECAVCHAPVCLTTV